jgi:hypothetical protein
MARAKRSLGDASQIAAPTQSRRKDCRHDRCYAGRLYRGMGRGHSSRVVAGQAGPGPGMDCLSWTRFLRVQLYGKGAP